MSKRRMFLGQLGTIAAGLAVGPDELRAASASESGQWDTSWLDRVAPARQRSLTLTPDLY